MADPATAATEELLKLGVPGIVIIFLGIVCYKLWTKLEDKDTTHGLALKEKDAAIAALQESRLTEAKTTMEGLTKATGSMVRMADVQEQLVEQMRTIATEYQIRSRGRP